MGHVLTTPPLGVEIGMPLARAILDLILTLIRGKVKGRGAAELPLLRDSLRSRGCTCSSTALLNVRPGALRTRGPLPPHLRCSLLRRTPTAPHAKVHGLDVYVKLMEVAR